MNITIDSREQSRIGSATQYYKKQGHTVTVTELPIGDYLFDNKICFEFKLISDFVASIQDRRVFNQTIEMSETYDYNFVVIQGDDHSRAKAIAMSRNYHEVNYFQY